MSEFMLAIYHGPGFINLTDVYLHTYFCKEVKRDFYNILTVKFSCLRLFIIINEFKNIYIYNFFKPQVLVLQITQLYFCP